MNWRICGFVFRYHEQVIREQNQAPKICIEPVYYRSASPTISMRTVSEFGEPDNKGHAKLKHKTEQSMMGQIQTVMGSVIGKH